MIENYTTKMLLVWDCNYNLEKFGICDVLKENPVSAPTLD